MLKLLLTIILPIAIIYILAGINIFLAIGAAAVFIVLFLILKLSDILMMRGAMIYAKDPVKALKLMAKGFSMKSPSPKYSVYYSYVCMREGKWEQAGESIKKIETFKLEQAEKVRFEINKSLFYWKQGELEKAIQLLEELLSDGESTAIYTNLGYFLILQKNYERALEINLKAYEYSETDAGIIDNLALTYYHLGEYEKSQDLYAELTEKKLNMPIPYYHYGELLYTLGKREEAIDMMEQALEFNFTHLAAVSKKEIRQRLEEITA